MPTSAASFVLTQFNSRRSPHISNTYQLDLFSVASSRSSRRADADNQHWFQGTADAVRKAARHFSQYPADYYLVLAGDHICRVDYRAFIDRHKERGATSRLRRSRSTRWRRARWGSSCSTATATSWRSRKKPKADRLAAIGRSVPDGATFTPHSDERPFMASMGIYVFSRQVLLDLLERSRGTTSDASSFRAR